MKITNIGFVGLGNVGSKVANNILNGGFNLYVYDLDIDKSNLLVKKGAKWCENLKKLANNAEVIITCLPSPKSVDNVMNSLLPYLNSNHLWIEMSTTDESEMVRLSKLCLHKKAETLEAPLTGGQHRAESGNIAIFVGGSRKNFKKALPILSVIGHEILHCGDLGSASTLKVVTNFLASIHLLALGEAFMVCKKYGLDLTKSYHGIRISSGNSFVHETESQVILNGSYDVGFTMDLVCKDLGLFNKLTEKYQIPTEIGKLINKIFNKGKKKYGERALSTSIVKNIEEMCNENLRVAGFPKKLIDNETKKKGIEININNEK